jgi:hypothetical protein
VSEKLSLSGYVVNGWNNASELDGGKTFALGATLKPTASVSWIGNYMVGREAEGLDTRHLFDTTLTVNATARLSLMGNFDYGEEGPVKWWGLAAYAKLQATPTWALVGRYEYLDDTKGGFMTFGTRAQTITVTSDHTIAGALKARLEYRTDFADEPIFEREDGSAKSNATPSGSARLQREPRALTSRCGEKASSIVGAVMPRMRSGRSGQVAPSQDESISGSGGQEEDGLMASADPSSAAAGKSRRRNGTPPRSPATATGARAREDAPSAW